MSLEVKTNESEGHKVLYTLALQLFQIFLFKESHRKRDIEKRHRFFKMFRYSNSCKAVEVYISEPSFRESDSKHV